MAIAPAYIAGLRELSDTDLHDRIVSEYRRWRVHREGHAAYEHCLALSSECTRRGERGRDVWARAVGVVVGRVVQEQGT